MLILVGNVQGTMSSVASPVSLGSLMSVSSSGRSHSVVRKVSLSRGNCKWKKRWHCVSLSVCRYSVTTTDFIADQGNSVSLDSNNDSKSGDSGGSFVLKPPTRPVLNLKSPDNKGDPVLDSSSGLVGSSGNSEDSNDVEERNKVIESLGEVLEKAEKLGNPKVDGERNIGSVNKPARPVTSVNPKADNKPVNSIKVQKSKTLKSVWRKGDSVASVQKAVKEVPRPNIKSEVGKTQIGGEEKATSQSLTPQPPSRPQPTLQSRPSVAPPPPVKKPVVKEPVVLKDKGAAVTPVKSKERKGPILIDKFASKKPVVDPLIARAVLAPTKPGKAPPTGRFRDDYRRKGASSGEGPRRRLVNNDDGIPDEDASELNVSIPGAARKGRKWSKASRKAARLQAAKDAAPVKVEILEVADKGMLVEELAYNLAISEGEILGSLYAKGIKPDGVQTLDKDMVKMVCRDYDVEVVDADPFKVEGLVKRRGILEEDDLNKLKDRPPVITIMGHVDHGKVSDMICLFIFPFSLIFLLKFLHFLIFLFVLSIGRQLFWIIYGRARYGEN